MFLIFFFKADYTESLSPGNPEEALWLFHTQSIKGLLLLKNKSFFGTIDLSTLSEIGRDHLSCKMPAGLLTANSELGILETSTKNLSGSCNKTNQTSYQLLLKQKCNSCTLSGLLIGSFISKKKPFHFLFNT